MRWCVWTLLVCGVLRGEVPRRYLQRVAEEAQIFSQMAPKVVGQETLEQVALQPSPRFQKRGENPEPKYKTRRILSEYGYSQLQEDRNLHEFRQVLSVDGKQVRKPGKLRETLSMGMQGDADRTKKRLLKEFQSYGLRDAVTDLGQLLLLFLPRQIDNYSFTPVRTQFIGPDRVAVLRYEQKDAGPSMTVFEGKEVVRHKLKGELWVREQDGLPLRVSLEAQRMEKTMPLSYNAVVDYTLSAHGVVLPVRVTYAERVGTLLYVENRFKYADFKLFGASSEVKFTVEESPQKK